MASHVVTATGGSLITNLFAFMPVRGNQTNSEARYENSDGSTITLFGSGFTYDAGGVPVAGTVTRFDVLAADGTTLLGRAVDVGVGLAVLDAAMQQPDPLLAGLAVLTALQGSPPVPAAWGTGSVLAGSDGGDTFMVDMTGSLLVEPGGGDDLIVAVTVSPRELTFGDSTAESGPFGGAPVEISYAEYTGTNGAQFFGGGLIIDPYGGTDTVSGFVNGARMTRNDDSYFGSDRADFVAGLAGNDDIDGRDGYETVRYDLDARYGGTAGVWVDLGNGVARDGFGDRDTFYSVEHAVGTNQAGGDIPSAGDVLLGNDVFNILTGLDGADYLDGRDWYDMADYSRDAAYGGTAPVYVDLGHGFGRDGWGNYDALVNMEHIRGTSDAQAPGTAFNDVLVGNAGHDMIQGLGGTDLIDGGDGKDTVSYQADAGYGGMSAVIVDLERGEALDGFGYGDVLRDIEDVIGTDGEQAGLPGLGDILLGNAGPNLLQGMYGNDVLDGRGGDDELASGRGNDVMTGGDGADLFWFDFDVGSVDRITDFVPGVDRIGIPSGWGGTADMVFGTVPGGVTMLDTRFGAAMLVEGAASVDDILAALVFA